MKINDNDNDDCVMELYRKKINQISANHFDSFLALPI